MNQVQPGDACERTRLYLDSYISNELLIETNNEMVRHLEECPACAAEAEIRSRLKERLKSAVEREAVPAGLEARVCERLQPRRAYSGWWASWMLSAAAAALFLGALWLAYPRNPLPAVSDRPAQAVYIEKISTHLEAVLRVGLQDHVHCAVFRRYPQNPPSLQELARQLGPDYQGLLPILQAAAPEGYRCEMAHHCSYAGRKYVHLTLRKGNSVLSLVIAHKNPGESMAGLTAARSVAGVAIYQARAERYQVAGFETGDYLAFVISELDRGRNLDVAAALAPGVKRVLGVVG